MTVLQFHILGGMPPLTDPELLKCFANALANWRYEGFVVLTEIAQQWLKLEMPGVTARELARQLHDFVTGGGIIDQQKENRPEWNDHDFHYDFRIPLRGRLLYIETRLDCDRPDDPDDPTILVANIHDV